MTAGKDVARKRVTCTKTTEDTESAENTEKTN